MSQRGGSVSSYLRFGKELEGPFMIQGDLDVLLAFEISEALRNLNYASKNTFVVASYNTVIPPSSLTHRTLKVDWEKCVGCGNCVAHCVPNQVYLESNSNHYYTLMRSPTRIVKNGCSTVLESCTGCIKCIVEKVCPFGAIQAFNEWEYPEVKIIEGDIRSKVKNAIIIDAEKLAVEAGNILAANVVLIGVLAGLQRIPIPKEVMKETVKVFIPKKALEVNLKAFDIGLNIGVNYKKS